MSMEFENMVRCNNCMKMFHENEIIYNEREEKEFCPCCGVSGCLMDVKEMEDNKMEEKRNYLKEFLEKFNNGLGFTFLEEEGHNLSKHELIDIAKELVYAIEDADLLEIDKDDIFRIFNENMGYEI